MVRQGISFYGRFWAAREGDRACCLHMLFFYLSVARARQGRAKRNTTVQRRENMPAHPYTNSTYEQTGYLLE